MTKSKGICTHNRKYRDATYSIHKLIKASPILSYKTRSDTEEILCRSMKSLHSLGYIVTHIAGIKQKHIKALVDHWKSAELSTGTIKNYVAKLRWACKALGRHNIISDSNQALGIEQRSYRSAVNKELPSVDLNLIQDPYIRFSIEAQRLFGLRREESLKLIVSEADCGEWLHLKGSWTKGGIPRMIPILTEEQRDYLNRLKAFVGKNASLIPKASTNEQQINRYVCEVRQAGFKNLHGLRHAYAQDRYAILTAQLSNGKGWECPYRGGPRQKDMKEAQRKIDYEARMMLSTSLGHSRVKITKIYLG